MNELVKWLRELQNSSLAVDTVFGEAADEIERLTAEIGRARSALHESYRTFGYSHEQSALMVSQDLSAGEERDA
jgi:hypothetical protein